MSLAALARLVEVLDCTGYRDVSLTPIGTSLLIGAADDDVGAAAFVLERGAVRCQFGGVPESTGERARADVVSALRDYGYKSADGVVLRPSGWTGRGVRRCASGVRPRGGCGATCGGPPGPRG